MKLSVITVVHNNVGHVEECLASVASQSYRDREHVVVDGGSTDGTLEVIAKYRRHISKFTTELDDGIYHAMNKGIDMATGDVVGFLNSDDYYAHDDVLQRIARAFEDNDVDGVYGDLQYVSKDGKRVIRSWKPGNYKKIMARWGWMPPHPTFYVKSDVFKKYGRFNTDYKIAADYDFILRLMEKHGISVHYLRETMIRMRIGGHSNKGLRSLLDNTVENYRTMKASELPSPTLAILYKKLSKVPQFLSR